MWDGHCEAMRSRCSAAGRVVQRRSVTKGMSGWAMARSVLKQYTSTCVAFTTSLRKLAPSTVASLMVCPGRRDLAWLAHSKLSITVLCSILQQHPAAVTLSRLSGRRRRTLRVVCETATSLL